MLTLDNLLAESQATTGFSANVRHLAACSPFALRLLLSNAQLLEDLLQHHAIPYAIADMQLFLSATEIKDEQALKKTLRQLRQRVLLSVMYRDLNGLADLNEVMTTITHLAEIALNTAINYHYTWLQALHGKPFADSLAQQLIVVGMGKLGGGELNVSSDVDLIFAYEKAGETSQHMSNQEFFTKLAKKVIAALDEVTEDGFVFRVDMRLRPFGSEGALVSSLDALEDYYQNNGREWERYAWIKGRVVAGLESNIHALLRPFIFRKYLDYNALNSMRDLKLQIHRDVTQKAQHDNIKLGRGGIREIEFIAQVFQLIRGGRDASLQVKPTLHALKLLKNKGLLKSEAVDALMSAYVFLRNLEHRLMYVEDAQTQELPKTEDAQARIAKAMCFENWAAFLTQLNAHRQQVQTHFDATFNDKHTQHQSDLNFQPIWQGIINQDIAVQALLNAGFGDAEQTFLRLQMLRASNRYQQLPELSRQRFDALMPLVIVHAAQTENADVALLRTINLLENICRRASYLALLTEFPQALHLVIKLCAASPWLAQYLAAHPILLDELLDTQALYATPNFVDMAVELSQKMADLAQDTEAQMDAMRHFKHVAIVRFAAQDAAGKLSLETLSDYLTALADVILQVSVATIWQNFKYQHISNPVFAIIAYGKLGSKELGYLSDLDVVFLYDTLNANGQHENAADIYARFAQRISHWFNSITNAGVLYEIDLQLRPDGNSGLLVSSVEAFRDYQLHKAWMWEHQALTRARFVAGDANIGAAFEQIRVEVITQARDPQKLKTEVLQMRQKMRDTQTIPATMFDVKHSVGGIIDVEFIVQYLVLAHAKQYPQLADNIGNIALLNMLAALGFFDQKTAKNVANAYREYRKMIHTAKLQAHAAQLAESQVRHQVAAVTALWRQVFEAS